MATFESRGRAPEDLLGGAGRVDVLLALRSKQRELVLVIKGILEEGNLKVIHNKVVKSRLQGMELGTEERNEGD
jgi:hypothetical protein